MTPNKEQMYLLIVALDLAGVGPTKGVKPDFASMIDTTIQNEIVGPVNHILSFGSNGPAGKHPAYPEKATTWKTLLKHGKKVLADYSTPINADLYNRIGAEYNMMQNTRKNPNGYTDGGGFKHSTSKSAIQKGIKDGNSHLHSLLFNILSENPGGDNAGLVRLGSIASQISDWGLEGPPKVKKPAKEVAPVINEWLAVCLQPNQRMYCCPIKLMEQICPFHLIIKRLFVN